MLIIKLFCCATYIGIRHGAYNSLQQKQILEEQNIVNSSLIKIINISNNRILVQQNETPKLKF